MNVAFIIIMITKNHPSLKIFFKTILTFFHFKVAGPQILTTVVPVGPQPTHMICPHCHAEVDTTTRTEPGVIAYISSVVIALLG